MIGSEQALSQKRTTEEWKNARVQLAKHGLQGVHASIAMLEELQQVCQQADTLEEKELDRLLTEALLPIGKVLVGMPLRDTTPPEILEPVERTLRELVRVGCRLFRQGANLKAVDLLLAVLDIKKPAYKQTDEEIKEAANVGEQKLSSPKEEAPKDAPPVKLPPPVAGAEPGISDIPQLTAIKETQTEDELCVEQDFKYHQQHPEAHPIVMKRPAYRKLASDLAQVFLEATDKVWQDFSNRPPDILDKYLAILKSICRVVYGAYLTGMFEKVRDAVWRIFTQPTEQFLRGQTKELLQEVTTNCEAVFDRLLLDKEKLYWCEHFVVEAMLPLVRCKLATKKLFGVKLLSTFANEIQSKHSKSLTEPEFRDWLATNRVLEEVFNLENHEQIIQQGENILEFLVRCGGLTQQQLDLALNIAEKGNPSIRKSMLSKMYGLVHRFGYSHYDLLMQRLQNWPHELFVDDLLDLTVSICRNSVNAHCQLGRDILWSLVSTTTPLPFAEDRLVFKFIDLMKITIQRGSAADMEVYIDKAVDLFSRKPQLAASLLRRMTELYPESEVDAPEKRLDTHFVQHMIAELQFHLTLLRKLEHPDLPKELRQNCMDLLHLLLTRYFKNFPQDTQLRTDMLLQIMNYPKLFSQLSQSFGETTQALLSAAVARPVNTQEELHCIWELFMNLNKEQLIINVQDKNLEVKCRPEGLKCYDRLLEIIISTDNELVRQETASYLAAIHCNSEAGKRGTVAPEFVEQLLAKINDAYDRKSKRELLGYYSIIEELMNETERKGVGDLLAHASLVVNEHVKIKVRNDATYGYDVPNRLELQFAGSKSLYELLVTLSGQFKCAANQLMLYVNENEPIRDTKNGLAVEDLNIAGKDLVARKVQRQLPPYAKLLDESKNFTPRALQVFTEIFQRFSTDGKMTRQDLAKFVEGSTQDPCLVNDSRITQTFDRYDDDKDNLLTLANFLSFYEEACRNREGTVWRNLQTLRYRHDLQKCEAVRQTVDYHNMVRFRLYRCAFTYDILFALTQDKDPELSKKTIRLLKRLPTSHRVLREILREVSFNSRDEFNVWYRLTLVQFLLSKKEEQKPQESKTVAEELHLKKDTSSHEVPSDIETVALTQQVLLPWKKKFKEEKYYVKILQEAELLLQQPLKTMKLVTRQSLSLCLKILRELNTAPELNKPLPDAFEVKLVELPPNKLVEMLLPQLFADLAPEMLEPLLCLALATKKVHPQILKDGLFHPDEQIRLICCNFLYLHEKQHGFELNLVEIPVGAQPKQFYELLTRVVRDSPNLDLQRVFTVMQREVEESFQNEDALAGRLAVMHVTLQKQPDLVLPGSYQATLLKILHGTVNHDLRRVLYSMLLLTDPQSLLNYLNNFVRLINPRLNSSPRSISYSGLYNLGCICYMNSMLQQFFMTTELRNSILGMRLSDDLPELEVKGRKHVDNLLYQLQKMFSYLQLSDRSDYNPEGVCYSFNRNINVGVQEDAQEFFNGIVDKLETTLKGTPYANLLRDIFGGKTLSTMTCQSCSKPRYKVEEFRSIVLEVKEKKNIAESLNRLVERESISDFYCEECGRRGEMIKETHLHTLPNILIVHLQRIIFDIETMERTKIHSKFEFPMKVNLKEYLRVEEGELPNEADCQYRLKGVVIHSGTPESGHYYSLIRVDSDHWIRFDDSRVSEFNMRDFEEEAFGGKQETSEWATYYKNTRSKNAYILVYEKINKVPIVLEDIPREELAAYEESIEPAKVQQKEDGKYSIVVKDFRNKIPSALAEELQKDNRAFFHERQFHHEHFRRFIADLLQKLSIPKVIQDEFQAHQLKAYYSGYAELPQEQQALFASTHELLQVLIDSMSKLYSPDEGLIKVIGPYLYLLEFAAPRSAQKFFMTTDLHRHLQILYSNGNLFVRELYRMTANKCINIIIHLRGVNLQSDAVNDSAPYRQRILDFLNDYLSVLYTQVPKNWLKSYHYFEFLRWFSVLNSTSLQFCFDRDIICQLVDLLLEKKSPIRTVEKKYELYIKSSSITLGPILQTIVTMVCASHNEIAVKSEQEEGRQPHILTQNERKCLTCFDFYRLVLENYKQDVASLSYLMVRFCSFNEELSEGIAALLIHSINQSEGYDAALCCMGVITTLTQLIHAFMMIRDGLTHKRLRWVFGVPQFLAAGNEFSIKNTVDSQVVTYMSSLYFTQMSYKSVLELLYSQRRSPDSFSIAGVSTLLATLVNNAEAMDYVLDMPPPSYCLATYVDWIDKFVHDVRHEKYPQLTGDRNVMADELAKSMSKVRARLRELRIARGMQPDVPEPEPEQQSAEVKTVEVPPSAQKKSEPVAEHCGDATIITEIPALIPAPVQEPEKLLLSSRPIVIFGRSHHIDVLPELSLLKEDQVQVAISIHHTYIIDSLPTGSDNQSLRKDLFESHANYDQSPLKFFTYKEAEIHDEEHPLNVRIEPRIIMLKITTKLPIMMKVTHPDLQADIYMMEGTYYLNTLYTEQPIDTWIHAEATPKKNLPGMQAASPSALTDAQVSYASSVRPSGFIGPLAPDHYQMASAPEVPLNKQIVCPMCTFLNEGLSVCEVCQSPLPLN